MRFVRAIAKLARWLSFAAAAAALLLALALFDEGAWVLLAVAAAVPAVVLFVFSLALFELAELPARLRGAPDEARELRAAVEDVSRARGTRLLRALWVAGRRAVSARELATPWAPLLPLASLPFLGAAIASALVAPALLVAAVVVALVAA